MNTIQYTIRKIPKATDRALRKRAALTGKSFNQTVVETLNQQLFGKSEVPKDDDNFDWLFGCNPWGTSMVYGLPAWGDFPIDPHSAFTHIGGYPIDGGLVDGPVNGNIYGHLIGIHLTHDDEYKAFQSSLAVYHDDYGDYSTNEPTMDGTATLIYLLASREAQELKSKGAKR